MGESNAPRSAVAEAGKTAGLVVPSRTIPIIVVPGIMGTRLSENVYEDNDPKKALLRQELVWNPLGTTETLGYGPDRIVTMAIDRLRASAAEGCVSPGPMRFNADRLESLRPLYPDILNSSTSGIGIGITDFNTIIPEVYGKLCIELNTKLARELSHKHITPAVFTAGYDWRQNNRDSAQSLATTVNTALKSCGASQAVIVAHSQGGIVARAFCNILKQEKKVKGIVLLGSPTLGAPKAYNMLKDGKSADLSLQFAVLRTLSDERIRDFVRRIPSVYQLCPSSLFGKSMPDWLRFAPLLTGFQTPFNLKHLPKPSDQFADCAVPQRVLYEDNYTGVTSWKGKSVTMSLYDHYSRMAGDLHDELTHGGKAYMHPNTYCIYTSMLPTALYSSLRTKTLSDDWVETMLDTSSAPVGDGTVPAVSAHPSNVTSPFRDTMDMINVDHGSLPFDPNTIDQVVAYIKHMF